MHGMRSFTLIEVLITLVILSISLLAIFRGNIFNLRSAKVSSDLTTAVIAAETLMKEEIGKGYPESGTDEGVFDDGTFEGISWEKRIEVMDLPFATDLKIVTVEVKWGKDRSYSLQTVITRQ
jgi:prepilin-type N-terminal cleavage/methylation domain-containing protein